MNGTEEMVKTMLEKRGYQVLRKGWPDFLCIKKTNYGAALPDPAGKA